MLSNISCDLSVINSKPLFFRTMKTKFFPIIALLILMAIAPGKANAQYYQIANTMQNLLTPALSGSGSYKGWVEAGYSHTLAGYDGDFIEFSTSQGYQYNSWFFLGAGAGVDVLFAHTNENWGNGMLPMDGIKKSTKVAPMIPLFTDFRFTIGNGNTSGISFFLDLKVGCSFLLSNKYIAIGDGYLTNKEYFFLDPSIGLKIPVSKNHPKQAFDVGVKYKLLTSNYWYQGNSNITLQSIGAFVAFEW